MSIGSLRSGQISNEGFQSLGNLIKETEGRSGSKHIRFEDNGIGLHTTSKGLGAVSSFFAKHFDGANRRAQTDERKAGAETVKQMVDRQYGQGVGDAVFKHLSSKGHDLNEGVTVKDLKQIQNWAEKLQNSTNFLQSESNKLAKFEDPTGIDNLERELGHKEVEHGPPTKGDSAFIYRPSNTKSEGQMSETDFKNAVSEKKRLVAERKLEEKQQVQEQKLDVQLKEFDQFAGNVGQDLDKLLKDF